MLGYPEHLGMLELLEPKEKLELLDQEENVVKEVFAERLGKQDQKEMSDNKGQEAVMDDKVKRVAKDLQVLKDNEVHQEAVVSKVYVDLTVALVLLVFVESQENRVHLV